jgi:flagellar protein FlaI
MKKSKEIYEHPLKGEDIPESANVLLEYELDKPYSSVKIIEDSDKLIKYYIIEPKLDEKSLAIYYNVLRTLEYSINIPRNKVDPSKYLDDLLDKTIKMYSLKKNPSLDNIRYYIKRDLVGLGPLEPLIKDENIEDISVNGINTPTYIWHRKFDSIPTNLIFKDAKILDDNILRLVHLGRKHISIVNPIVDAALPGGHRLHATFKQEVSPHGSSITIRKFREIPLSIIDLINYGTLNYIIGAYCWLLFEYRTTAMVIGSTGSGKTTTLNAILSLIPSDSKIITIEEVKEINIYHDNWVPLLVRMNYTNDENSISAFRLVKAAMRMRPDILVIGEVRGEEAYALFQAISTGHGGMFTIHAEDTTSALQRMISKPMDVAPAYIQFLDIAFVVRRVDVNNRTVRRVISIDELDGIKNINRMFEWNAKNDTFTMKKLSESIKLKKIAEARAITINKLIEEIGRRIKILYWINMNNIRDFREITKILQYYRYNASKLEEKVMSDFKEKNIDIDGEIIKMINNALSNNIKLDIQQFKQVG